MLPKNQNTKEFFEGIVADYDDVFKKLVSPFPDMIWTMFHYLPEGFAPSKILELGCGTGNLTRVLVQKWPESEITVVDISKSMLEKTQEKTGHNNLKKVESAFTEVEFKEESFDLVTSSLAIHHITNPEKQRLIKNIFRWLRPNGVFMFNDCVRAESDRLYKIAYQEWINLALSKGLSRQEMDVQLKHHEAHDHFPVLIELANWLKDAGFKEVDILWKFCFWAVLCGHKLAHFDVGND